MNAFEEFMFDESYVLRFYRVDHGLVCAINESMVSELREVELKLRQQQAELDRAVELYTDKAIENEALKAGKIRAYDNGVEDGRKPDTNNKPVAWMETYKGEPNNLDWDKSNLNYGSEFHDVVPLYTHPVSQYKAITNTKIEPTVVSYTHPVKELTDEEINAVWFNYKGDIKDFARAILRKASEK